MVSINFKQMTEMSSRFCDDKIKYIFFIRVSSVLLNDAYNDMDSVIQGSINIRNLRSGTRCCI